MNDSVSYKINSCNSIVGAIQSGSCLHLSTGAYTACGQHHWMVQTNIFKKCNIDSSICEHACRQVGRSAL